jgi:Gamma tubulin complex component C-terminal
VLIQVDVIDVHFGKLLEIVNDPTNINSLHAAHHSTLQKIIIGCFLTPPAKVIYDTVLIIVHNCTLLSIADDITLLEKSYNNDVKFLFRVFEGGEGFGVGMEKFLMRLDYNGWARRN